MWLRTQTGVEFEWMRYTSLLSPFWILPFSSATRTHQAKLCPLGPQAKIIWVPYLEFQPFDMEPAVTFILQDSKPMAEPWPSSPPECDPVHLWVPYDGCFKISLTCPEVIVILCTKNRLVGFHSHTRSRYSFLLLDKSVIWMFHPF